MRSEAAVREFQRLFEPGTVAGLTECQLVERFAERGDPVAFEAIVMRHGPMVYTVCRQMLRDPNDVDDAFQATFLILIKKARKLRRPERLGPWLYGVAYRVAHRMRIKRPIYHLPGDLVGPRLACSVETNEQVGLLHDEIQRLPEKYRVPIVLCCIEGLNHEEAASRLGWPVGTVHGRLSRARDLLRGRLTRRGVIVSEAIPEALALIRPGQMIVPDATRLAALALMRGTVPTSLAILTKGTVSAMITEKLKQTGIIVVVALIGLGSVTTGLLAYQRQGAEKTEQKLGGPAASVQRDPRAKKDDKPLPQPATIAQEKTDDENALQNLDELRVDVEMRQIELETNREYMRTCLRLTAQINLNSTKQLTLEAVKDSERRLDELQAKYRMYRSEYRVGLIQIADLKRKIARKAKALGQASGTFPDPMRQEDRLDHLEEKLDRIIETLTLRADQ